MSASNKVTARSQMIGCVVFAMWMVLHEETLLGHRLGPLYESQLRRIPYLMNTDVHEIDVMFVDERDNEINPLDGKGVGEIGGVGTAAAIANAVFHVTGKRMREWPITLDNIIG